MPTKTDDRLRIIPPSKYRSTASVFLAYPAIGIMLIASFAACSSCKEVPIEQNGPSGCRTDEDCIAELGSRWFCNDGECIMGPRYCEEDGDAQCCPGQTCNRYGVCVDRYDTCDEDADCRVAGQRCLPRLVSGTEQNVCTFALCEDGACEDDLHCFAGHCIGTNPCRGGCPEGQACVLSNNQCHPAPMCDQICPEGSILVFGDPDNVDDACDIDSLFCTCEALPPLTPRDIGRHSGMALVPGGGVAVSAYNGDYGDLVVAYFDSTGALTSTDWVDGVPNAAPVANPAGPRGGIDEAGPDVGRYTSIAAAQNGVLHVSYFDVDEQRLKYARRSGDTWTTHVVDEEGDVGRYSAIALDSAGVPFIAYFRKRGLDDDRFVTALKVARAQTTSPENSNDWSFAIVDSATVIPPPCDGECPSGQHCVDDGVGTSCHAAVSGCSGGCPDTHRCVDLGVGPTCRLRVSTSVLEDLPDGTGLFPSIVITPDATATVVFYDRQFGRLKMASGIQPSEGQSGSVFVIDGDATDDVGRYPSATLDSGGDIGVIYQDAAMGQLKWARVGLGGEVRTAGIVDDGVRDPLGDAISLVGVDNALAITSDGVWLAAYQNATAGELVLATRSGGDWTLQVLDADGAAGFWTDSVLEPSRLYVSHAVIKSESSRPVTTKLLVQVLNL